jgi:ABC-type nitrate/sulfonate/bicarbonate transport system ATPase subunit
MAVAVDGRAVRRSRFPDSAGDAGIALRLWHEIHPKIFFITHDVEEAIFLADRVYVMSAAPGRIKEVLDVPFPKPRTIDIVTMAEFVAIKDHVLRLIRSEFQASDRRGFAGTDA